MADTTYNYTPTYIKRTIANKPKDVVRASYWNELFNLLITQGDHTAEELGNILNHFSTKLAGIENEIAESAEDIANIHGVFRINVTYSNGVYTADKTFNEIKAAYDAGQLPYVVSGSDTIYTLTDCYLATEQMAMDFKRYLIGDDTLEDNTLRIYSYTTDNGSNIVRQNTEFNIPIKVLEVTLTTQNSVTVADKTFAQVETAVEDGIPVLKVHSDGDLLWFFLLDKSPTEIDFIGFVDEQIIAYLTAKQDGTWETTVAARVTAEMLSSLNDKIGNIGQLTTTDKTNLVAAINEVKHTADSKQDRLIAGDNITIAADGRTISATGGGTSDVIGYFEVTLTEREDGLYTGSKTFAQVKAEIESNKRFMFIDGYDCVFIVTRIGNAIIEFAGMSDGTDGWLWVGVASDERWEIVPEVRISLDWYNLLADDIGKLTNLTTTDKSNLVAAINEVKQTTVELDTTLTQSGKAADAKAVGDALAGKQDKLIAGENITIADDGKTISATGGTNWYVPDAEEAFGETGTEGEGSGGDTGGGDEPSGEPSYVTANLAAMYDFTKYEDGYQGEVEDLSGNGVVPTITGLDAYQSGRQGFIGGKLMMGENTTSYQAGISTVTQCTMTIDCDAVKSHPYSIEVYGFLRKQFKQASPAGTLEYENTSVPGSWNMLVANTIHNATTSTDGWNFVASENYAALWGVGNAAKLEATDIELSIGGVNNTNVTGADTHLVYCVDGNLQKIYVNGVLVASAEVARDHATDNILKVFPSMLAADLKMFRLYKSVLSDFDVYTNYQQAVSTYSGAAPVMLAAEVTAEDTVTRKAIKEMDNFPVTLARATYMNNSNTTVEDEINTLKSGGANSATVVRSAEVGDTGIVSFKNAAGVTVFEADLAHMNVGALQLPRVYLTGSTVNMGKDSPVKMAFKFADAEQTITGWADVEWQGNTSIVFPIKNYGIDLYEDEAMTTKMDISVLPHMATDSYHLKANYIDPSNVKNLAGARLFKYICDTVGLTFPNSARCVVDGRPVEVYVNGKFNGIYTFNYKQSKSLFSMGSGNAEFIYRCEVNTGWGLFEGTSFPTKEEFDLIWEARYPKPKNLTHHNEIQRMLQWVNNATADEFKTNIGSYLNLQSCLIYLICGDIMAFRDNSAKNLTVCSWDGQVWYTIPYDMDMGMMDKTDSGMESHGGNLWNKINANFDAEKKALYAQLRNAGMDANTIFKLYSDILYPIGVNGYTADRKVKYDPYTNIDSRVSFVDFDDYIGFHKEFIQARIGLMDEKYGYTAT